jgi:hypothetical protein
MLNAKADANAKWQMAKGARLLAFGIRLGFSI